MTKVWLGASFGSTDGFFDTGAAPDFNQVQFPLSSDATGKTLLRTVGDVHVWQRKPDLILDGVFAQLYCGVFMDRGTTTFPGFITVAGSPEQEWLHTEALDFQPYQFGAGDAPTVQFFAKMHVDTPVQRKFVSDLPGLQVAVNGGGAAPAVQARDFIVQAFFRLLIDNNA